MPRSRSRSPVRNSRHRSRSASPRRSRDDHRSSSAFSSSSSSHSRSSRDDYPPSRRCDEDLRSTSSQPQHSNRDSSNGRSSSRNGNEDEIDRERAERRRRALEKSRELDRDNHPSSASSSSSSSLRDRYPSSSSSSSSSSSKLSKMIAGNDDDDDGQYEYGAPASRRGGSTSPSSSAASEQSSGSGEPAVKAKPNFGLSGQLYAERMTHNGVVQKYAEPTDAAKPEQKWRIYVFKQGIDGIKDTLHIHRQSKFLVGREQKLADIHVEHASCSKQHAVIQYRRKEQVDDLGNTSFIVKPYIIDLGSTNGTFLNGKRLESARYYELLPQDVLKFGESTRDYVLIRTE